MIELMDLTAVVIYLLCAFYYCWQWWKADRAIEKLQKSSSEQSEKIESLELRMDFIMYEYNQMKNNKKGEDNV